MTAPAAAAAAHAGRCGNGGAHRSRRAELDGEVDDDIARLARNVSGSGSWSLTKRMTSPSSSDSSAPKMAAWRKRLATPRASKG